MKKNIISGYEGFINKMDEESAMSPLDDCPESSESNQSCDKQMIDIINSHRQNNHNNPSINGNKIKKNFL